MYSKNLTKDLRLRLSEIDMDFLTELSKERTVTVSECIRQIIGEYRRSLETMDMLKKAIELERKGGLSHGDTKTDFNDKLQQ